MPRRTLSPDAIVDAAIALTARPGASGISGRALGDELGVDRSAIWRHFADQDELLRAVGDRLLRMSLDAVPGGLLPRERMNALARALVRTFSAHPSIGALVAGRTTRGAGELAVVEFTLRALAEVGVPADRIAVQQRMIADAMLGYAGLRASQDLLPPELRRGDAQAWSGVYSAVSPTTHPAVATHVGGLASVSDDDVLEALLAALWTAVSSVVTETQREDRNDGHA
ncbi:TetR/AcrR family transcriptional regulator [Microbacterium sp. gxy059]|uniref:TetR/AcrR family transcriptional regulator n=1 Tax=Microbacterium sp. gxy059 TaxID=2957199 RepID=UPI003D9863DE